MTEKLIIQWIKDNFDNVKIGYFLYWIQLKNKPERQFYKEYSIIAEKENFKKLFYDFDEEEDSWKLMFYMNNINHLGEKDVYVTE